MQQLIWAGKNKELTVPRVLQWPTFFTPTEMLPVERVAVDWERGAKLLPYIASLHYINTPKLALLHPWDLGQSCLNKIGAAHHWPSSVWIGRKTINPLMSYIKPQITPPSPLIFAILNGGSIRRTNLGSPRGKPVENTRHLTWRGGGGTLGWGLVWLIFNGL